MNTSSRRALGLLFILVGAALVVARLTVASGLNDVAKIAVSFAGVLIALVGVNLVRPKAQ